MTNELQDIVSGLRALSISKKGSMSIRELLSLFTNTMGYPLNYRKFGFKTAEDFLKASEAFYIRKIRDELFVIAIPSDESRHISDMVSKQKSSSRVRRNAVPCRQPKHSDQSWNTSSYSSVYQKIQSSPGKLRRPPALYKVAKKSNGDNNNNNNNSNNISSNFTTKSSGSLNAVKQPNQNSAKPTPSNNSSRPLQTSNQNGDLRDILNQRKLLQEKYQNSTQSNGSSAGQSMQKSLSGNQQKAPPSTTMFGGNTKYFENAPGLKNRLQYAQESAKPNNTSDCGRSSLQNRLMMNNLTQPEPQTYPTNQPDTRNPFTSGRVVTTSNTTLTMNLDDRIRNLQIERNFLPSNEILSSPTYENISNQGAINKSGLSNRLEQARTSLEKNLPSPTISHTNNITFKYPTNNDFNLSNQPMMYNDLKNSYTEKKPITSSPSFDFDAIGDPIISLIDYCKMQNYPMPEFEVIKPFSKRYCCYVYVKDSTFSTYPEDFATDIEAKVACARKAIKEIKESWLESHYALCMDTDDEIASKIYQEVINHPQGIFCKKIPEVFQNTYKQKLPEHWLSIIQSSRHFIVESAGDNLIVFTNSEQDESETASLDSEFLVLDKLSLPWENKYWNLHITNCVSTVEIWARLVGEEYSDQLDSLMNDIDVYMLTEKVRPVSISCGQIYLVSISECWQRVQVEDMNKSTGSCLCLFIDFGDEEWLAMEQLFICEPEFLRLPPQAISFSLFGLEDFAENPSAKKHLDDNLIGRSLVGEILTKQEEFEADNNEHEDSLQVVLYDTSSSEDVNLNPLILNKICDDTPPPQLNKLSVTNVNITNISNGDIFLQIKSSALSYVEKLIQQLVEAKFKEEQHKVTPEDMRSSNMFLIKDDKRWYRGILADDEPNINNWNYKIFYVDYGKTNMINITNIFRLDSLSAALNKFPKQAVKVRLHNIPPITDSILARIKGLLPVECSAIVKIAVNAIIPQVNIYRRFDDHKGLFKVNDVIRSEHELESDNVLDINGSNDNSPNIKKNDSPTLTPTSSEISIFARGNALKSPITVPSSTKRGDLPKLKNVVLPPTNDDFSVFVTMASNPNNFIVQPYDDGPNLLKLMTELQDYCNSNDEYIPKDMLEVGQAYAARAADGCYQRVVIENIFHKNSTVHIYYCDYGVIDVISVDNLKTLPMKFRHLPKQAISARLYGVKPKHVDWRPEDCIRFKELTEKKGFASVLKEVSDDPIHASTTILHLQLIDVSTDIDVLIEKILIDEGRAVPAI